MILKELFGRIKQVFGSKYLILLKKLCQLVPCLNGILALPVRAVPNGPNEIHSFKSGKGQNIQHWIMLIPMPVDVNLSMYITEFITKFQALSINPFFKSAYKYCVEALVQHPGLKSQISEEGRYWNIMEIASQKDFIFQSHNCLSEFLLDHHIKKMVNLMFGVEQDPMLWTDCVKKFAFGK